MTSFRSYVRRAALSLLVLALVPAVGRSAQAQDTHETIRVRAYHDGAMKTAAEGTLLCPGTVPVGTQALTIDYEVTTTSTNPVQYTATFSFANQTLEATVTSDTHGDPAPVVDGGTTTYTVEGLLSNTMPFRVSVVTTATAAGPATTDWEVRRAGAIIREEHCAFNVIEGGGGPEADLALAVSGIQGSLSFDVDAKTAKLPLGEAVTICIQVVNNGPDEATEMVITGGMDPAIFEIQDVTLDPPLGTCSFDPLGGFFSCAGLTLPAGDSVKVNLMGVGVAETEGEVFSASAGHPNDPDFSNNDDFVNMAIEPVGHAGSIEGTVFLDLDGDGILNADLMDVGLEEQLVFLDLNYNGQYDIDTDSYTTSDADGVYHFENLPQVVLEVGIVKLEGWEFTIPADGFQTVDLNEDPEQEDVNFGTRPRPGAILGAKWEDRDADGQIDEGEPRLEGWTIYLDLNNNGMFDDGEPSDSTDGSGLYAIVDLDPGTYTVREVQQEGFAQTFPQDPDHYTVTLGPGEFVGGRRFGNRPVGSIHGVAYEDLNANGQRDRGEPGIDGARIALFDLETGIIVAQTETMAVAANGDSLHGVYWFEDVPPGTYEVQQIPLAGFAITEPPESPGPFGPRNTHVVVLAQGEREDGYNFGNAPTTDLSVDKDAIFSGPEVGSIYVYYLTVRSGVAGDAPNTVVRDALDKRLEFVSATTTQGRCSYDEAGHVVTCDLNTVAPLTRVLITITVRVLAQGEDDELVNTATVESGRIDRNPNDNEESHSTQIFERSLDVTKEASSQDVQVGDRITYTIVIKSNRPRDVVVTDTLSDKVSFASVSASRADLPCRFDEASRTIICGPTVIDDRVDTIRVEVVALMPGVSANIATAMSEFRLRGEVGLTLVHADTVQVTIEDADPTSTESDEDLPDVFRLHANYPNPFNPVTTLVFDLPEAARVRVELVDVLGRVVWTLPPQPVEAGARRTLDLDVSALPSGTYLYRLTAAGAAQVYRATGRFVLVK